MDQILSQGYDWEAGQKKPLHSCHLHSERVAEGKEKEELDVSKSRKISGGDECYVESSDVGMIMCNLGVAFDWLVTETFKKN